jgi:hypothetical protein
MGIFYEVYMKNFPFFIRRYTIKVMTGGGKRVHDEKVPDS